MNINIKSYIIPIIIIIISVLLGFSIYNVYFQSLQEGLENRTKKEGFTGTYAITCPLTRLKSERNPFCNKDSPICIIQ